MHVGEIGGANERQGGEKIGNGGEKIEVQRLF